MPLQVSLKQSEASLTRSLVGSLGPGVHKVLFEPSEHFWLVWSLMLNTISPLLLSCWGFSFALGCWVSFLWGSYIRLFLIVQWLVAISEFSQEMMNTSFYSTILCEPTVAAPKSEFPSLALSDLLISK